MMSADAFLRFPLVSLTRTTRDLPTPRRCSRQLFWYILLCAPHVSCFLPPHNMMVHPPLHFSARLEGWSTKSLLTFSAVHFLPPSPWCLLIFRIMNGSYTHREAITEVTYHLMLQFPWGTGTKLRSSSEKKVKRSREFQTHRRLCFTEPSA